MTDFDAQAGRDLPTAPASNAPGSASDDADVATALQGLSGLVADAADIDTVLAEIAGFAVTSVPNADGAGVTSVRLADGVPTVLAWSATDRVGHELDHLQYEVCREGPCLTAMQNRRPLISGSLGSDRRWPRFGSRAARLQVHSALSLPLVIRDVVVGALNVYARDRDVFTEHALRLGEQFAGPAAVSVRNVQTLHAARTQAEQLQAALTSRAVIDQAIGIVRSRSGGTAEEAFDRLRRISQTENVKLAVVAERLVEEAVRRAHARHGQG